MDVGAGPIFFSTTGDPLGWRKMRIEVTVRGVFRFQGHGVSADDGRGITEASRGFGGRCGDDWGPQIVQVLNLKV